jgi:hypothetical protein
MLFPNGGFSEPQPIVHTMPFIIGISEAIGLLATRTLYSQLVFEVIGYSGFAVNHHHIFAERNAQN